MWERLLATKRDDRAGVKLEARNFASWRNQTYMQTFLKYLQDNANAIIPMDNSTSMLTGLARTNVFKEIIKHLSELEGRAEAILGEEDE
jgi:hypothetical protein